MNLMWEQAISNKWWDSFSPQKHTVDRTWHTGRQ